MLVSRLLSCASCELVAGGHACVAGALFSVLLVKRRKTSAATDIVEEVQQSLEAEAVSRRVRHRVKGANYKNNRKKNTLSDKPKQARLRTLRITL